jgi:selenocysteine lyase/cysteine desulfurase
MDGLVNVDALKKNDLNKVDLLIVNHISNVNGVIQPLKEIKEAVGSVPIMIDASQSLGKVAVNVDDWNIDFLAFTGHKGLLGPTGTGGCYIKEPLSIKNTLFGGTGSNSESIEMPTSMPDRFQPGTPNVTGLYGLLGALNNRPVNNWDYERLIALINNLQSIDSIKVISANDSLNQGDVFSIFPKNGRVSEFATLLFQQFGIETRSGLHCSPLAHKTIKTFPSGTVRISLSPYHTNADLDYLEQSIKAIYDR